MRRNAGFTLVEIMIVVAIIALLAAIAIPQFSKHRTTTQKNACITNLKQLDGAKELWAADNRYANGASFVTTSVAPYLKNSKLPNCPGGGTYTYGNVGTDPACSLAASGHTIP